MKGIVICGGAQGGPSRLSVLQGSGESADSTMSQRAVTALSEAEPEVRIFKIPTQRSCVTHYIEYPDKGRVPFLYPQYTGDPVTLTFNGFDVDYMDISGATSGVEMTGRTNFTLKPGCIWEDGTCDTKTVSWLIQPSPGVCEVSQSAVTVENDSSETLIVAHHEGAEVTATFDNTDIADVLVAGNEITITGKRAGNAALTIKASSIASGFLEAQTTIPVSVIETVAVPQQNGVLYYTGVAQTPAWEGFDPEVMEIVATGENTATNAGIYTATFRLTAENYRWSDGTRCAKHAFWEIQKAVIGDVPVQSGRLAYTGSEQTVTWYGDTAGLIISGTTKATDAGTYNVTFQPTINYTWSDGTQGVRYGTWEIAKADSLLTLSPFRGTVDKNATTTFTAVAYTDSPIIVQSQNPNVALASVTGTVASGGKTTSTITITGGTLAGETVLTVLAGETANRIGKSDTYTVTNWLGTLTPPTIKAARTYTGSSQTPDWQGYDANTMVSGGTASATNAGEYTVTVTPKPGYRWANGRTDARTYKWNINKAAGTLTLSSTAGTVDNGKTVTVTATPHSGGTISASSSNTNCATVSVSGNTVTITGKGTAGTATITITASATANYNAISKTYTITNYLASLTIPTTTARTYNASSQSPNWSNLDTAKMTTGGTTSATNAGTYSATVTPKSGYRWTDGTTSQKTVSWKINKANGYISRSDTQKTWANVEQGQTLTYTFNMHPGATLSATSSENTNVYTVSTSGNELRIRGGNTFGANGYKITVTAGATANYNAASMTCAATNWVGSTPVPVMGSNRTYNKAAQSPNWTTLNTGVTVLSGTTSATNAGTYTVKTTPKSGYRWAGTVDSTAEKSYGWTINKAEGTLTVLSTTTPPAMNLRAVDMNYGIEWLVQRNTGGTISAVSRDTAIATAQINTYEEDASTYVIVTPIKKGSTTVEVSADPTNNYTTPKPVQFIVNSNIPSSKLSECTWKEIKGAVNSAAADKLWQVGDLSPYVHFQGSMGGTQWDEWFNFRIVKMTNIAIWFYQAQNRDGVEIALVDNRYQNVIYPSEPGLCINPMQETSDTDSGTSIKDGKHYRSTNIGGYANSYMNRYTLNEYYKSLPDDLRSVIATQYSVFSDNAGGMNADASAVTTSYPYVYLASQIEILGHSGTINSHLADKITQWPWFQKGNSTVAYSSREPATAVTYWLRDPYVNDSISWKRIGTTHRAYGYNWAADSRGIRPAFCIAS